ncbi:MAG: hypothetical protein V2I33_06790 [Kangiellaceae bacterium]|jgi:hypothetical protein|nr:hypothetical protein [Kangiellaceae bacterium]
MRIIASMFAAAIAVAIITFLGAGIYGLFPDGDEDTVTPILLDDVITEEGYSIESLKCECRSEKLEFRMEETENGLGCKAEILTVAQLESLPECDVAAQF